MVSPYMDPGMNFFHRPGLFTQFTTGLLLNTTACSPRPARPGLPLFILKKKSTVENIAKRQINKRNFRRSIYGFLLTSVSTNNKDAFINTIMFLI